MFPRARRYASPTIGTGAVEIGHAAPTIAGIRDVAPSSSSAPAYSRCSCFLPRRVRVEDTYTHTHTLSLFLSRCRRNTLVTSMRRHATSTGSRATTLTDLGRVESPATTRSSSSSSSSSLPLTSLPPATTSAFSRLLSSGRASLPIAGEAACTSHLSRR